MKGVSEVFAIPGHSETWGSEQLRALRSSWEDVGRLGRWVGRAVAMGARTIDLEHASGTCPAMHFVFAAPAKRSQDRNASPKRPGQKRRRSPREAAAQMEQI